MAHHANHTKRSLVVQSIFHPEKEHDNLVVVDKMDRKTTMSLSGFIKRVCLAILFVFTYLFYTNHNTREGDQFRHRPLWLYPLRFLPHFDLKVEWFIYGGEDQTTLEGLTQAVNSLNTEAQLNNMGRIQAAVLLTEQLQQRACVTREIENNKNKRDLSKLDPPIVVLGVSLMEMFHVLFQ
jgi:hypothetical protein